MNRTTRRIGRLRALAVMAALAGSVLTGALPAAADSGDRPGKSAEQAETPQAVVFYGFSWG